MTNTTKSAKLSATMEDALAYLGRGIRRLHLEPAKKTLEALERRGLIEWSRNAEFGQVGSYRVYDVLGLWDVTPAGWAWLKAELGMDRPADDGRATLEEALGAVEWDNGRGIETAELAACLESWSRYGTVPSPDHSVYAAVALSRKLISRVEEPRGDWGFAVFYRITAAGYAAFGVADSAAEVLASGEALADWERDLLADAADVPALEETPLNPAYAASLVEDREATDADLVTWPAGPSADDLELAYAHNADVDAVDAWIASRTEADRESRLDAGRADSVECAVCGATFTTVKESMSHGHLSPDYAPNQDADRLSLGEALEEAYRLGGWEFQALRGIRPGDGMHWDYRSRCTVMDTPAVDKSFPAGTRVRITEGQYAGQIGTVAEDNRGTVTNQEHRNYGRPYVTVRLDPTERTPWEEHTRQFVDTLHAINLDAGRLSLGEALEYADIDRQSGRIPGYSSEINWPSAREYAAMLHDAVIAEAARLTEAKDAAILASAAPALPRRVPGATLPPDVAERAARTAQDATHYTVRQALAEAYTPSGQPTCSHGYGTGDSCPGCDAAQDVLNETRTAWRAAVGRGLADPRHPYASDPRREATSWTGICQGTYRGVPIPEDIAAAWDSLAAISWARGVESAHRSATAFKCPVCRWDFTDATAAESHFGSHFRNRAVGA